MMFHAFCSRAVLLAAAVLLSSSLASRYADATGGPPLQVNTITLSYFPLIPQSGVPQDEWPLDTKQARQRLGLDPSQAAIDDAYGEYNLTLAEVKDRVRQIEIGAIDALEEGTRFHGYKAPQAKPFINYNIINRRVFLHAVPLSDKMSGLPVPDYLRMMRNNNVCYWVDQRHVKEVWIFDYAGAGKGGWESNFSSRYDDISNSDRDPNDLPICAHSYTVYGNNYGRTAQEAVENHMHQFEAIFSDIDFELFGTFTGWPPVASGQIARCGNAHFPPNGETDYDWTNPRPQRTDCEDWRPVGYGKTKVVTCNRWNCNGLDYFKYWMQNIPGFGNRLSDCAARNSDCQPTKRLKNWWTFIYNFDVAYRDPTFWRPVAGTPEQ